MRACAHAAWEEGVVTPQPCHFDPGGDGFARRRGDLELHWVASLVLDHDRPAGHGVTMADIAHAWGDNREAIVK